MATQIFSLGESPVNLLTSSAIDGNTLSLEVGKTYAARYVALGVQSICKILEVPAGKTVEASDPALPVRPYEDITIVPKTGIEIFIWSEGNGQLGINDTA
jgi:hypothetical protein